jgi:S-DNA-T family DNA segregation ATPase FtsK/SpoIIIE
VRHGRIALRELLEQPAFRSAELTLPLALGSSLDGSPLISDLARMPHLLIAGSEGSDTWTAINATILSLLYRLPPDACQLLLIDPSDRLSVYDGIPHLLGSVVSGPQQGIGAIAWALTEADRRIARMARLRISNIDIFNNRTRAARKHQGVSGMVDDPELEPMPRLVVVVREIAELMSVDRREVDATLVRLAPAARAAGIHLVVATQCPFLDLISDELRNSLPSRICFRVASKAQSRAVLNVHGAEQLATDGDMLLAYGNSRMTRARAAFFSEAEIEDTAAYLRAGNTARTGG